MTACKRLFSLGCVLTPMVLYCSDQSLIAVMRFGGCGNRLNFHKAISRDGGKFWGRAVEMKSPDGKGIGTARPQLLLLGGGRGPLLLSGSRVMGRHRAAADNFLWVNSAGDGETFDQAFSISGAHNMANKVAGYEIRGTCNSSLECSGYTSLQPLSARDGLLHYLMTTVGGAPYLWTMRVTARAGGVVGRKPGSGSGSGSGLGSGPGRGSKQAAQRLATKNQSVKHDDTPAPSRSISWWWDTPATADDPAVEATLKFCREHRDIVQTLIMRCNVLTCCRTGTGECGNHKNR